MNPSNSFFRAATIGIAVVAWLFPNVQVHAQSYVNFEGKQTRPISLSPDGTRLFAVNTPDARVSVFDVTQPSNPRLLAEIPVGIEPVSVTSRDNDKAGVVNEVSDSISIISVSNRTVVDTISAKDEPADIVFAGSKIFVSEARNNQIAVFDIVTHALLTNIAVFGENPRALAVNAAGTKVYAAFALSGNHTTLVNFSNAPPQATNASPPMNPALPAPPQVGLIVDATNAAYFPSVIKYTMPDNDVVEIDVATMTTNRYFSRVGAVNLGLAVNPVSGDLYVANTEARNVVHFEPNVRGHIVDNRIARITIGSGSVTNFDLNPGVNYAILPNPSGLSNALAQPTAIVFDPGGTYFYVAAFGSDRVAKVDTNGNVLARIEIGPAVGALVDPRNKRGPRGLALNAGAQRLYVLNRIANTISIVDTVGNTVLKEIPIGSFDPTPASIRNGRGFLYDAKLAGNGNSSCAACHVDAEMDRLAWDLGDPTGQMQTNQIVVPVLTTTLFVTNASTFHPMKGPMATQTLRGLNTLDPFHWRGDRTNFLHFNGAFGSLLGGTVLSNADMAAYRDFINTIAFEPNPNENLDRTLPVSFAGGNPREGFTNFVFNSYVRNASLTCNNCHSLPEGSSRLIVTGAVLPESQDMKVAHLRNLYQKNTQNFTPGSQSVGGFGFLHDGMFPDLFSFLSHPVFQVFSTNSTVKSNLTAFMLCLDTGTAPAVGYSSTMVNTNVTSAGVSNNWSLLESEAAKGTNIDLIVKGRLNGQNHGYLYDPVSHLYFQDSTNLPALTRAQLAAQVQTGVAALTLMGVTPGAGTRMGIDRDLDGTLDADTPPPKLHIAPSSGKAIINWPFSAAGYLLESTDNLASNAWTTVSNPVEITSGQNFTTNTLSTGAKFFRLRLP